MHALRMDPMLRWAIALIVASFALDHAGGEGRMGPSSFARAPGRLSWAQGGSQDGFVRKMEATLSWHEESSRNIPIRPLSSPAFDCIAAHFCLTMRLRGGAAARRGKRGGGSAKAARKRKAAPVVDNDFGEDAGDKEEDFEEDGDALQGEIGAIAANLERELGDVDAAVKAAGAGASSAGMGRRSKKTTSLDENPSVKSAIAGLENKMRASGKTEEELAEEQQRLFEEMRAQMSSNMAREMGVHEEGQMAGDHRGRKEKGLSEGFDAGTGSQDKAELENDSVVDEELDGFDDEFDALMGMVGGDKGIRDLDADGAAIGTAAIKKGKASRSGKSKDAGSFDWGHDGQDLVEEEEEEEEEKEESDVYDQESAERGKERDANNEEKDDVEYGGEGREDENVDEAEARLMDIDDGPVVMPSQWTGTGGAENFAKELGDVAKMTGEFAGLDEFSSSSGSTVGGPKKRQRAGEDGDGDRDVAQKGGTTLASTSFLEGGWNKSFFEEGLLKNASFVEEEHPGDSNSTLEDTDEEPDPGWDGFWKDADYEYSVYKWVAGTEGKEQPGRMPNMTDAEYFAELEAEGNRFLKHNSIPPEIHPSNRNGTMPSKSIMREVFPDEMSEDSDEGLRRSSVSSSDFVYDVPNNETEGERIERENKEIRATGVTRDFRRAWEGDSSDTWEDSEDNRNLTEGAPRIKRRRIPGSPTERMNQHFESQSMLGMVPHSRPGKGVGEGMAPPIRNLSDMIDQAGFAGKEYVYTTWGRLRDVPPMRDCMADRLDGGNRTGGYGTVVSELNWSPEDRVRLNITADDQPEHHKGMSGVHFRKIVSAREFLENTPVDYTTVKPDPSIPSADFFEFSD